MSTRKILFVKDSKKIRENVRFNDSKTLDVSNFYVNSTSVAHESFPRVCYLSQLFEIYGACILQNDRRTERELI